jgi:hypothetical protein
VTHPNVDDYPAYPKNGISIRYTSGSFDYSLRFDDTDCIATIEYIANFMLGCGFTRPAIIAGLKQVTDTLEASP